MHSESHCAMALLARLSVMAGRAAISSCHGAASVSSSVAISAHAHSRASRMHIAIASTRSVHRGVDVTLVYQVESAVLQGMLRGMTIERLSSVFAVSLATMLQLALDR